MGYKEELNIGLREQFAILLQRSEKCDDKYLSDITLAMIELYNVLCDDWEG